MKRYKENVPFHIKKEYIPPAPAYPKNNNMKNKLTTAIIVLLATLAATTKAGAQQWAVHTNGLYWLAATPNAGVEFGFHRNLSIALSANYNPFTFKDNRKFKHWLLAPEFRLWKAQAFKGHYFGLQALAGSYNVGNLPFGSMTDYRYEGDLYGAAFTYGYQWNVSPRLNIGAGIGLGYLHLDYQKFYCPTCGERIDHYRSNYLGPTNLAVNIIYMLK